jgi:tRNA(Ile2) C34 agmatinyltransferase TiaS
MFPVDIARAIIMRLTVTARFEYGQTRCPVCGTVAQAKGTGECIAGYQTRYHECPGCGATFKSVGEKRGSGETPDNETTEQPAPHNRGRKGRRK